MKNRLDSIHDDYMNHKRKINDLEKELAPHLEDTLGYGCIHIFVAEDEGYGIYLVHPLNYIRYLIDEEHIEFIKVNNSLDEKKGFC